MLSNPVKHSHLHKDSNVTNNGAGRTQKENFYKYLVLFKTFVVDEYISLVAIKGYLEMFRSTRCFRVTSMAFHRVHSRDIKPACPWDNLGQLFYLHKI